MHDPVPYSGYIDPESLQWDDKERRQVRQGFIRKVYGILLAQLTLTTLIASYFTFNEGARIWIATSGSWLTLLSTILAIGILLGMSCVPGLSQSHPTNMYLLFGFTICQALCLATVCASVAAVKGLSVVLQAFVCCSLLTGALTVFAFQTKYDLTQFNGMMLTILMGFAVFGLLRMMFPHSSILETIYAVVGAVIFSAYIVIDTQLLIGSKALEVDEDQYVMIALSLYMDIINLFVNLLQLLSSSEDN